MRGFKSLHPIVLLAYFVSVIGVTIFTSHPVYLVNSVILSVALGLTLETKKVVHSLFFVIPTFLIVAISNPLFVHDGITVLLYINNNPITVEAILYGFAIASMIVAMLFWFISFNSVMTSDKIIYLFGKGAPAVALIISMTLSLVPRASKTMKNIRNAQASMGVDITQGSLKVRIRNSFRILSMLITYMLENGVDTADSMRARGYGLSGRRTYSNYKFHVVDGIVMLTIVLLTTVSILNTRGFHYYPTVAKISLDFVSILGYASFFILSFLPIAIEIWQMLSFRRALKNTFQSEGENNVA